MTERSVSNSPREFSKQDLKRRRFEEGNSFRQLADFDFMPPQGFVLTDEIASTYFPQLPGTIIKHVQKLDGTYLSQSSAMASLKPSLELLIGGKEETYASAVLLEQTGLKYIVSGVQEGVDSSNPRVIWAGVSFDGEKKISELSSLLKEFSRRIKEPQTVPRLHFDTRAATWFKELTHLYHEEARKTLDTYFRTYEKTE